MKAIWRHTATAALIAFYLCVSLRTSAQTNLEAAISSEEPKVIFDELLSTNGSILMTHAEFMRLSGRRLIFQNNDSGSDIEAFDVEQLDPAVLARLNLDPTNILANLASQAAAKKAQTNQVQVAIPQKKLDPTNIRANLPFRAAARTAPSDRVQQTIRQKKLEMPRTEVIAPPPLPPRPPPPPLPPILQPQRPLRTPVDLSDKRACLNELADLATFPMYVGTRDNPVGMGFFPGWADPENLDAVVTVTDYTVRFDHLEETKDADFRKLVQQARLIVTDIWRAYRQARASGYSWRMRQLDQEAKAAMMPSLSDMLPPPSYTYRDVRGIDQIDYDAMYADEARRSEESRQRTLSRMQTAAKIQSITSDVNRYGQTLSLAEAMEFDELADFWEQKLWPRLMAADGDGTSKNLLEANYKNVLTNSDGEVFNGDEVGCVSLRNSSGQMLSNIVVRIEQPDKWGGATRWYGHVRELPAGTCLYTKKIGVHANIMTWAGTAGVATVSVLCDSGRQEPFQAHDLAEGYITDNHVGPTDCLLLGYEVPYPWEKTRTAEMTQYHNTLSQTATELAPAAGAIRQSLLTNLPPPGNAITAQAKLQNAIVPGKHYRFAKPENTNMLSETATFETNDESGAIIMRVYPTWNPAATNIQTAADVLRQRQDELLQREFPGRPLPRRPKRSPWWTEQLAAGRYCDDEMAGCVLGFEAMFSPSPLNEEKAIADRQAWLVTAPDDILFMVNDRNVSGGRDELAQTAVNHLGPKESELAERRFLQRIQRTGLCHYVVYLDDKGQLCVQISNSIRFETSYIPGDISYTRLE